MRAHTRQQAWCKRGALHFWIRVGGIGPTHDDLAPDLHSKIHPTSSLCALLNRNCFTNFEYELDIYLINQRLLEAQIKAGMSHYSDDVKYKGIMQKKGGLRWQKRYFILYRSGTRPARLSYFKDDKFHGGDPRATLELTSDTKVDLLLGKTHAFQVILKGILLSNIGYLMKLIQGAHLK